MPCAHGLPAEPRRTDQRVRGALVGTDSGLVGGWEGWRGGRAAAGV